MVLVDSPILTVRAVVLFPVDKPTSTDQLPDEQVLPAYSPTHTEGDLVLPPEVAWRYDLKERIARGGMGTIYRARDRMLNRTVAIKVLRSRFLDRPDLIRRFMDEAQISGQLQHPGVVPVYEVGNLPDNRPFIAMKLIEGVTLSKLLRERLNNQENLTHFLKVFETVCQTVSFAHSQGVIHRDLKPDNIMVGAFGEVQVMDWGLAKNLTASSGDATPTPASVPGWLNEVEPIALSSVDMILADDVRDELEKLAEARETPEMPDDVEQTRILTPAPGNSPQYHSTHAGVVFGTPSYMSPEQAAGNRARIDTRTDVFALGAILCQILTNEAPYTGTLEQIREQAVTANLTRAYVRLDASGADQSLVMLAKHCLAANPDDRPADGENVSTLLEKILERMRAKAKAIEIDHMTSAARLHTYETNDKLERKARRMAQILAVCGAMVACGMIVCLGWYVRDRDQRLLAEQAHIQEVKNEIQALLADANQDIAKAKKSVNLIEWRDTALRAVRNTQRAESLLVPIPDDPILREEIADIHALAERTVRMGELGTRLSTWQPKLFRGQQSSVNAATISQDCSTILSKHDIDPRYDSPKLLATTIATHPAEADIRRVLWVWLLTSPEQQDRERVADTLSHLPTSQPISAELRQHRWTELSAAERTANHWQQIPVAGAIVALKLVEHGEQTTGQQLWQVLSTTHPSDYAVNALWGRFKQQSGDFTTAIPHYKAAVAAQPNDGHTWAALGDCLLQTKQETEALVAFRSASKTQPDLPMPWLQLAKAAEQADDLNSARHYYEKCLQADRANMPSLYRLAQFAEEANDLSQAERCYGSIIAFDPEQLDARRRLGTLFRQQNRFDDALRQWELLVSLNETNANDRREFAQTLAAAGKLTDAQREARQAVMLAPKADAGYRILGDVLLKQGDISGVTANYRMALKLNSTDHQLRIRYGQLLLDQGNEEGLLQLRQASELSPGDSQALMELATGLARTGRFRMAATTYREAAASYPADSPQQDELTKLARRQTRLAGLEGRLTELIATGPSAYTAEMCFDIAEMCAATKRSWTALEFLKHLPADHLAAKSLYRQAARDALQDRAIDAAGHTTAEREALATSLNAMK